MQAITRASGSRLRCTLRNSSPNQCLFISRRHSYSTQILDQSPIPVFRDVPPLRALRRQLYRDGKRVGFIPTMGALHDGHLSLVRHALHENTDVFISIFVNPTQFGANEDLGAYPRTWEADVKMLLQVQEESEQRHDMGRISGIFAPKTQVMYPTLPPSSEPDGDGSFVTITPLSKWLEGASRPTFFRGVATVCTKLFNAVQPDVVYFGQKDAQQSVMIKRMVKDFLIPTEVRVIPTSREADGLAMSSRNVYLGDRRRRDVVVLSKALLAAQKLYDGGERSAQKIREAVIEVFDRALMRKENFYLGVSKLDIDYVALTRADDMTNIENWETVDPTEGAILSAAMYVWPIKDAQTDEEKDQRLVRLIDNVILEPKDQ